MAKRMTRKAAVAAIADILAQLREGVSHEDVCADAQNLAEYTRAYDSVVRDWPLIVTEWKAGEIEGVDVENPPTTWAAYAAWISENGEWDEARWGVPPAPETE